MESTELDTFEPVPVPRGWLLALAFLCALMPFSPFSPLRFCPQNLPRMLAWAERAQGHQIPDLLLLLPALSTMLAAVLAVRLLMMPMITRLAIDICYLAAALLALFIAWWCLLGYTFYTSSTKIDLSNANLPLLAVCLFHLLWILFTRPGGVRIMLILITIIWMNLTGLYTFAYWSQLPLSQESKLLAILPALLAAWTAITAHWHYVKQNKLEKAFKSLMKTPKNS